MDAGVAPIDIETKKRKEEMKLREAQARAVSEHGELALIAVDSLQTATQKDSIETPNATGGAISFFSVCSFCATFFIIA